MHSFSVTLMCWTKVGHGYHAFLLKWVRILPMEKVQTWMSTQSKIYRICNIHLWLSKLVLKLILLREAHEGVKRSHSTPSQHTHSNGYLAVCFLPYPEFLQAATTAIVAFLMFYLNNLFVYEKDKNQNVMKKIIKK